MAKRLTLAFGIFILTAILLIPLAVAPVSAATDTNVTDFQASISAPGQGGYRAINSNPTKAYTLTYVLYWVEKQTDSNTSSDGYPTKPIFSVHTGGGASVYVEPEDHKVILTSDTFNNGYPTSGLKSVTYPFEYGKYYRYDFTFASGNVKVAINGRELINYSLSGYNPAGYIIMNPKSCRIWFLRDAIYYTDGTSHHDSKGTNVLTQWSSNPKYTTGVGIWVYDLAGVEKALLDYSSIQTGKKMNETSAANGYTSVNLSTARTNAQNAYDNIGGTTGINQGALPHREFCLTTGLIRDIGTVTLSSGTAISNAESSYSALTAVQKKGVSNYSTLTTDRKIYDAMVAINSIGTPVTLSSATALDTALTKYNAVPEASRDKVTNYSTYTGAKGEYDALKAVYDKIAAIGTVTLDSGSKITAAESAYNALAANSYGTKAERQGRITNYSTLTTARSTYDKLVAARDAIDAIGTPITLDSATALSTALTKYNAVPSASRKYVTNYSTYTGAKGEYDALKNVYDLIADIGSMSQVVLTDACHTKITTARAAYNALTANDYGTKSERQGRITNKSNLGNAEKIYAALEAVSQIGTPITLDSAAALENAQTKYTAVSSSYRKYVTNYSTYTAAKAEYDELKNVYDLIAAIGTVTLDSNDAITAAEDAYNALAANDFGTQAERQARITNYSTLDLSRKVYTAEDYINQLPATIKSNTSFTNAKNAYNAVPSASRSLITNGSEYTAKYAEYQSLRAVYNKINVAQIKTTVTLDSASYLEEARAAYDALTDTAFGTKAQRQSRVTNRNTLFYAEATYDALYTIDQLTLPVTLSSASALSNALDKYNAVQDSWKVQVTNYDKYAGMQAEYDILKNVYDLTAAIGSMDQVVLTEACHNKITAARAAYNALTSNDYGTSTERKKRVTNRGNIGHAERIYAALEAIDNIGTPITLDSASALSNALTKYNAVVTSSSSYVSCVTTYSTYTGAQAEYDALKNVYDLIDGIGSVTTSSGSAITAAENAYNALAANDYGTKAQRQGRITNYSTLTDARAAYDALTTVTPITVASVDPTSSSVVAAYNEFYALTDAQKAMISDYATVKAQIDAAKAEYDTINPVYTQIEALGTITLASKSAIDNAKASYNTLTSAQKSKVDAANTQTISAAETAYNNRIPTVAMTGTPDSSKIKANIYFLLTDGEDPSAITVTVDGVSRKLNGAGVTTKSAGGGKTYYILSTTKPAKQMTQGFAYSISGYGNTYASGTTTVAYYLNQLLSDDDPEVVAVARAMLNYGRAAQVYFKYPQANPTEAQLPANSETPSETVTGSRFDSSSLVALTNEVASCPVGYSAINVTFKDDTTLYIAFRIKDNSTEASKTAALNWVKEHVTFGGNTGDALNAVIQEKDGSMYSFVIISIKNIPIKNINVEQPILVDGASAGALTVMNYIVISQKSSDANLKALTQGLLAYYNAITALITP